LRHPLADMWTGSSEVLRRFDARSILVCALAFLVAVAVTHEAAMLMAIAVPVAAVLLASRIRIGGFLLRLAAVMPIAAMFAGITALTGDLDRALTLFSRSLLSASIVLLLAAATPFNRLLEALLWLRTPVPVVDAIQFLYRYLIVLREQVWRMRTAAAARGGTGSLTVAMSHVGVLFAGAHGRAERVHQAMLARAWHGGALSMHGPGRFRPADYAAISTCVCWSIAVIAAGR
jgi:cobalt/nickel transport system permease protein